MKFEDVKDLDSEQRPLIYKRGYESTDVSVEYVLVKAPTRVIVHSDLVSISTYRDIFKVLVEVRTAPMQHSFS